MKEEPTRPLSPPSDHRGRFYAAHDSPRRAPCAAARGAAAAPGRGPLRAAGLGLQPLPTAAPGLGCARGAAAAGGSQPAASSTRVPDINFRVGARIGCVIVSRALLLFSALPRFSNPLRGIRTAGKGEGSPGTAAPNGTEPIHPLPPRLRSGSVPPRSPETGAQRRTAESGPGAAVPSTEAGPAPPDPRGPSGPPAPEVRAASKEQRPPPHPAQGGPPAGAAARPAQRWETERCCENSTPPQRGPHRLGAPRGPRRAERSGPPRALRPPPPHLEVNPRNRQTGGTP